MMKRSHDVETKIRKIQADHREKMRGIITAEFSDIVNKNNRLAAENALLRGNIHDLIQTIDRLDRKNKLLRQFAKLRMRHDHIRL